MKVRELIEVLQHEDLEATAVIDYEDSPVCSVSDDVSTKNEKIVYIERCSE